MLAALMKEGLSCYCLQDVTNPLLQKMRRLPDAPVGSSQMTKNLLEAFLIGLMRHTEVLTKEMRTELVIDGVRVPERLKEILDFINLNIYGKLTITDVARHTGKSESAVKQLFSDYMNEGIISYYTRRKISEAKRLIRQDIYNMTQISDLLKFDTPQYFSRCFKRVTNMTPSEYKLSIIERL
jgi:AraC-like DNA-binding protein